MNYRKGIVTCLVCIIFFTISAFAYAETYSDVSSDEEAIKDLISGFFEDKEASFVGNTFFDSSDYYSDYKKDKLLDETSTKLFEFERIARANVCENVTNEDFGYSINEIIINDNTACVEGFEWYEYTYKGDETRSSRGVEFSFECIKQNNVWKIDMVSTNNELEYLVKDVDDVSKLFLSDEIIDSEEDIENGEDNIEPEQIKTSLSTHSYSKSSAASYALQYSDSTHTNSSTSSYNSKFANYAPNDCQNFVSQCVWCGLGGVNTTNAINNRLKPMITTAGRVWYGRPAGSSNSWIQVGTFHDYVAKEADGVVGIYGIRYAKGKSKNAQKGDVIQICYSGGGWYHSYIINAVTGTFGERTLNDIRVCAHTCNRRNENLAAILGANSTLFRLICIKGTRY